MQDADIALCLCGSGENSCSEIFFCDDLRTTESKKNSTWPNLFKSFLVKSGISFHRIPKRIPMFRKGWWIKYD